jgi:hypothetical protein
LCLALALVLGSACGGHPRDDGVVRATVKFARRLAQEAGYTVDEDKIGGVRLLRRPRQDQGPRAQGGVAVQTRCLDPRRSPRAWRVVTPGCRGMPAAVVRGMSKTVSTTLLFTLLATTAVAHADLTPDQARLVSAVERFARVVRQEIVDLDAGDDSTDLKRLATNCHKVVAEARAAGVPDTTPVVVSMYDAPEWRGTLAEAEVAWCKAGDDRFAKYRSEKIGPYIKAGLKNDKLEMIEEVYPEPYYLAGGQGTTDPARLAKAKVWFWDSPFDEACSVGKHGDDVEVRTKHVLHRYQFDGQGKLIKETTSRSAATRRPRRIADRDRGARGGRWAASASATRGARRAKAWRAGGERVPRRPGDVVAGERGGRAGLRADGVGGRGATPQRANARRGCGRAFRDDGDRGRP